MAFIAESYTGTNGTNVSGTLTPAAAATIQGDRCRMVTNAAAFNTKRRAITGLANGDAVGTIEITSTGEHYIDIVARANATDGPGAGYSLTFDVLAGQLELYDIGDDAENPADSAAKTWAATTYRWRFRFNGSSIQARVWAYTATEPDTWDVDITSTTTTAAGSFHYAVSAETTARTVWFDNLFIDDLSVTPGAGTTAAAANSWGTATHTETFADPTVIDDDTATPYYFLVFEGVGYQGRGTQSRAQVSVNNGQLTLYADEAGNTAALGMYPAQKYGRFEIQMRIPYGDQFWHPVLLHWPESEVWPDDGEIDWAEMASGDASGVSTSEDVQFNLHYSSSNLQLQSSVADINLTAWHWYAVDWSPDGIRAYLDGALIDEYLASEVPEAMPPGPMWLGVQLDNYDDNLPVEMRRPAAMQINEIRVYAVTSAPAVASRRQPLTARRRAANF